ncbi:hypothetical protein PsorP6_006563 [Peronosclerospora sorghi]|uniref:Uncharacterized protein n=1 Tax=Peronosclerospora sorghi TaxID=230839 RepID=A0ACC0W640_9STRA|nr:hypothetical protein PsorP6_006563 [Peronosclerospora sorghi]
MNGANSSTPCRAIGISEGTSTVLGDVFMGGLYSYHDRAEGKIGLAVADKCPNTVISSKKVYASKNADIWCSCFSSTIKTKSSWSLTNKQMKQLQEEAYQSGSVGAHTARLPATRSSRGAALAPAPPPSRYFVVSTPTRKTQSTGSMLLSTKSHDKRSIRKEKDVPVMGESKYSNLSSPRSPLSSTSSIALLSGDASGSNSSKESWRRTSNRPYQGNRVYESHKPKPIHSDDRWGASLK